MDIRTYTTHTLQSVLLRKKNKKKKNTKKHLSLKTVHVSTHSVAFLLDLDLFILYILYIPMFLFYLSVVFFVCLQCCTEYKQKL